MGATGVHFKQLYGHFKRCKIEDLRYVQEQLLPALKAAYNFNPRPWPSSSRIH